MNRYFFLVCLAVLFASCTAGKKAVITPVDDIQDLPELVVTPEPQVDEKAVILPYRAAEMREWDLLDTDLDIQFNWENSTAPARAILTMTPLFYPQTNVELDAVGFHLLHVGQVGQSDSLAYRYDGVKLRVELKREIVHGDTLRLEIEYVARPEMNELSQGRAVTSDKGLYFINPIGQYKDKPRQVWTQGETQANSRWVPTFDQPNERATQTFKITVDTIFETLSNGLLTSSLDRGNGKRTDTWRMELPHAPYLMMIAVGDYSITRETWQGIPIEYYVEHGFEHDAKAIFPDVAAMLSFYSDYTGVAYPWSKLAHVVVRDYVSGAMENTTAIVYSENVQRTSQELVDEMRNEQICAHEIFHQWFGDLVTCESWSNTVLNEGFANYGEYLWTEFKYGQEEAEIGRQDELGGYLNELRRKRHPLVDFHYDQPDDMFDAHSYNKGGMVLHMLRQYLGEPLFRAGLTRYLEQNAYSAVEIHHLRLAMESVSGQDLNWFFNQWYFAPGHPTVKWDWNYNAKQQMLTVRTEQVQLLKENNDVYRLPSEIAVLLPGDNVVRFPLTMDEREQFFTFKLAETPVLVDLDPDRILLMEQEHADWSPDAAQAYWRMQPSVWTRLAILDQLGPDYRALQPYPWQDAQWQVRSKALDQVEEIDTMLLKELVRIAREDAHSELRARAIALVADQDWGEDKIQFLKEIIASDKTFPVQATALYALFSLNKSEAMKASQQMDSDESMTNILILSGFFAQAEALDELAYFHKHWENISGYPRMSFMKSYIDLVKNGNDIVKDEAIDRLILDAGSFEWTTMRRYAAFRALALLRQQLLNTDSDRAEKIRNNQDRIKSNETDPTLLRYYNNY